ncbi:MAG: TCP-1/cpn60 chaperonin family protein [Candidatus Pacearchaeota archaeon]|nr:MAG: TCP-1/cpn60 chaperonin family protein [Candidatus Pacearchaeota archaeon]
MAEKQPIYVLPENIQRMIGRDAQRNNILAARLVADAIKTTLGPKGMDKMLVDSIGDITVTNDGVTILDEMEIEHPAAKMMVEIAKTQEDEVGDGTTTAVIIAGKLLENAEKLLDEKIHPTVIARGYRLGAKRAHELSKEISYKISPQQKDLLKQIVITAMTGKGAEAAKEKLSQIVVEAVLQVMEESDEGIKINRDNIKLEKKKGEGIEDTKLISGIVLDKERVHSDMPSQIKDAKIALLDAALELKSPETDTKIQVTSPEQLQAFIDQEEKMLKDMVNKIKEVEANVVLCQKGIDDVAQYYLTKENIFAARRIKKSDMELLAKATGSKIVSNLNELSKEDLGHADVVKEIKEGEEGLTYVMGCRNPKALTILIRGGTEHVIDELERAIKDGIGDVGVALEKGYIVAGGGAFEIELARRLRAYGQGIRGREQLAINAFADSLEVIPRTLAENAGLDPIDTLTELKARHDKNETTTGLDTSVGTSRGGEITDALKQGIVEPLEIKNQAIKSASEVTMMILRIDDVIASSKTNQASQVPEMPPGY